MATAVEQTETVTISIDRLKELEAAANRVKKQNQRHYDITRLQAYNKEHPEKQRERIKRYYERHKEEIKAKRREKYKLQKAEKENGITTPGVVNTK
jgi:sialic acid synthase SpsE